MNAQLTLNSFVLLLFLLVVAGCGGQKDLEALVIGKWNGDKDSVLELYRNSLKQQGLYDQDKKEFIENRLDQWAIMSEYSFEFRADNTFSHRYKTYDDDIQYSGTWQVMEIGETNMTVKLLFEQDGKQVYDDLNLYFDGDNVIKMYSLSLANEGFSEDVLFKMTRVQ